MTRVGGLQGGVSEQLRKLNLRSSEEREREFVSQTDSTLQGTHPTREGCRPAIAACMKSGGRHDGGFCMG
jgi:hypothetical protein